MTALELARFMTLRADLFAAIGAALAEDGHCKSYEGAFSIELPNYFEHEDARAGGWVIGLDCYVVGPSRHYQWAGITFGAALAEAERDIRAWIAERAEDE